MIELNPKATSFERLFGLDAHPDSFTVAALQGPNAASAVVQKVFNKVPLKRLTHWAQKNTTPEDLIVLEASGNSFHIVRTLASLDRRALVLESAWVGKLKEAHANNDKISAVRIGKAFLAGNAKRVWVPDPLTQERRDCFHAYTKATRRTTQMHNRIRSYLSDYGVRVKKGLSLVQGTSGQDYIAQARDWSPRQWQVIEGMLMELRHADLQRTHWRGFIAQEVLNDPLLLSLVRLCGVREVVAFALGAIIGDIHRFANPRKLIKYVGLNPAFDDSGQGQWHGGIGGHGRKDLRALLIQAAQSILRSGHPLAKWGKKLWARKSARNLAVAAVARKLTVAVWYLLMGRWSAVEEIDARLSQKIGKIISQMGKETLQKRGQKRAAIRQQAVETLKTGRIYILDLNKKFTPKTNPLGDAVPQTP
jgi:transposase